MVTTAMKLKYSQEIKMLLGKKSYEKPIKHIKKYRPHFANKDPHIQAMTLPAVMYKHSELDPIEG